MSQKNGKIYGKLLLDLIMLLLLALMYRKNAIGMHFHETGGLVLCGLFLMHKLLNWRWIRAVTGGVFRKQGKASLQWVVDVLLLVSMTAVLITGLLISKTLPTAIQGARGLQVWHYFAAAAALVLCGIHLGLHGALLRNRLWNRIPLPEKVRKAMGIGLLCVVLCFGSYSLLSSGFLSNFSRPFLNTSAPAFYEGNNIVFEAVGEHPMEEGHMGKGNGSGMGYGKGKGMGQGMGMNRGQQGAHSISAANVLSTLVTYTSILGCVAVVTAVLVSRRKPVRE